MATPTFPILIVGAGLGSLLLAQGLKKNSIPFHIYERDPTRTYRPQGYRIRISEAALRETLPADVWIKFEQSCGILGQGGTNIDALTSEVKVRSAGPPPTAPGILADVCNADRTTMRKVLLAGLDEHITFGKEFKEYTLNPDGYVTAHFSDSSSAVGILLVGADGVKSRVRRQFLPDIPVVDLEGRAIFGKTTITDEVVRKFTPDAMKNMTMIKDPKKTDAGDFDLVLFLDPMRFKHSEGDDLPKDYVYWVLLSHKSAFPIERAAFLRLSKEDAAKLSLELTAGWHPSTKSLLELQDVAQTSTICLTSIMPTLPPWTASAHITLLGDAIHPMSPTAGMGAANALRDAAELVKVLCAGISAESIGDYEEKMRARAAQAVEGSAKGGKHIYGAIDMKDCKPVDLWGTK